MTVKNVAVIFDDRTRPDTTGVYCRRALGELVSVQHFHPSELDRIPTEGFDLYVRIDDGLDYILPRHLHPSAIWVIDTHMDFTWCLRAAQQADYVFAAQRDGTERLRQEGVLSSVWLPLACDPAIHRSHCLGKSMDLCFVGNIAKGERADLLKLLQRTFRHVFVGQAYFEEMAKTYSSARMVFNRSIRNDINMRVFEALACGSLLITNDLRENGQAELFRDGVHLATYEKAEDLLDKVRFYLTHENVREQIAAAGREEALARHTYRQRMEVLLQTVSAKIRLTETKPAQATNVHPDVAQGVADPRDAIYFGFDRPELLALIPRTAERVLDIGCGAGMLGENLKRRQTTEVIGIEVNATAAELAKKRLDQVFVGDVERLDLPIAPSSLDAVICGDVLEHLRQPSRLLQHIRVWLRPGGLLIASIPNVRHWTVVGSLFAGNWTYKPAGLMDQTHLQFFTRKDIQALLQNAGFQIRSVQLIPGPGYEEWSCQGRPLTVQIGRFQMEGMCADDIEELFVYQYVVCGTVASAKPPPFAPTSLGANRSTNHPSVSKALPTGPMKFAQDFVRDFDQFDFFGPPFAFVRFRDGERAVCMGKALEVARDGWSYRGGSSWLADDINRALRHTARDYYIGISDGCCDRPSRDWYLQQIKVPLDQVTFANVFVNANYRRFLRLNLRGAVVVGSGKADFKIPQDVFASDFNVEHLVSKLLTVDRPILVAAGPVSAAIIYKYWLRAVNKQPIVDVGSAIDEWTKGYKTRAYQHPGSRTADLICQW